MFFTLWLQTESVQNMDSQILMDSAGFEGFHIFLYIYFIQME